VPYHQVGARDGRGVSFARVSAVLSGQALIRFAAPTDAPAPAVPGPDEDMEPGEPGLR